MGNHDLILDHDLTSTLIRIKARQLCRRSDFSRSDFDDLRQGMFLYVLEKSHLFDSQRGTIEAFVTNAVNTWVAMLLRSRSRLKRSGDSQAISLEGTLIERDGEETSLKAVLSIADLQRRTGAHTRDPIDQIDLRDAMARAVSTLTSDEQSLLRHVAEHGVASAARKHHVSRRQIENALARMRSRFEDAGLGID